MCIYILYFMYNKHNDALYGIIRFMCFIMNFDVKYFEFMEIASFYVFNFS